MFLSPGEALEWKSQKGGGRERRGGRVGAGQETEGHLVLAPRLAGEKLRWGKSAALIPTAHQPPSEDRSPCLVPAARRVAGVDCHVSRWERGLRERQGMHPGQGALPHGFTSFPCGFSKHLPSLERLFLIFKKKVPKLPPKHSVTLLF